MATQTEESRPSYRHTHRRETSVSQRDIAALYSKLQFSISFDHDQHDLASTTRLKNSSRSLDDNECPCSQIVVSDISEHCALCDRTVPVLEAIQAERQAQASEKVRLQTELAKTERIVVEQEAQYRTLDNKIEQWNQELELCSEKIRLTQPDLARLDEKYRREQAKVASIQLAKEEVEKELQDLSQKLFAEAKGMVADEQRAKSDLEKSYKHLSSQLHDTQAELEAEELRLTELRHEIVAVEHLASGYTSDPVDADDLDNNARDPELRASRDLSGLFAETKSAVPYSSAHPDVDPMLLADFEEWIHTSQSVPLKKLESVPFVKYCIAEDVEPCLRFGPDSRLSARKLSEAILANSCALEETPYQFIKEQQNRRSLHHQPLRISAQKTLVKWSATVAAMSECQACGRKETPHEPKELVYRFRTSCLDDWACIDRHCRDRIMAVSEFYVFLRYIHQGYYNSRSTTDLYHEMMRLRLQMFYARVGALPLALHCLGIEGDAIGTASGPQMKIQPPENQDFTSELEMHC